MTPTEPRGGERLTVELFQRLDEILVEESPMHPFGCATWMEATQVAIDMAKEALSRPPVVHGWPDREAVARVIDPEAFEHPTVHPQHLILRRARARSKADAILRDHPLKGSGES